MPATVVTLALAAGCTPTSVRSVHLNPDRPPAPAEDIGVPYQLTQPRFTITPTPATDTAGIKYTLGLEFVADRTQQYGLHVRPGSVSEADMEVALSAIGGLSSLSMASREQVTPTIKAVGDFVGSIVGVATSFAGLAKVTANPAQPDPGIVSLRKELTLRVAERKNATGRLPEFIAAADAILARLAAVQEPDKDKLRSALVNALRPLSGEELDVLEAAADPGQTPTRNADAPVPEQEKAKGLYEAAQNLGRPAKFPDVAEPDPVITQEWKLVIGEVAYSVERQDLDGLTALGKRDAEANLARYNDEWRSHLKLQAKNLADAGRTYALASTTFPTLVGKYIGERKAAKVRLARVTALTKQIDDDRLEWLFADANGRETIQKRIDALEDEKYELMGTKPELGSIRKLEALLAAGPAPAAGRVSPLGELTQAREQLAKLREDVAKKLAQVVKDAADPDPEKEAVWLPGGDGDVAFLWNQSREQAEGSASALPRRILRGDLSKPPTDAESVAARVSKDNGGNASSWPKFVVRIKGKN